MAAAKTLPMTGDAEAETADTIRILWSCWAMLMCLSLPGQLSPQARKHAARNLRRLIDHFAAAIDLLDGPKPSEEERLH
jgi:hypothetical protein